MSKPRTCRLAQLNESILIGLPYLIAVYMVRDWLGPEASEERIGRMTGLLVCRSKRVEVVLEKSQLERGLVYLGLAGSQFLWCTICIFNVLGLLFRQVWKKGQLRKASWGKKP